MSPRVRSEKDHVCICFGDRPRTAVEFDGAVEMSERLHRRAWDYFLAVSNAKHAEDELSRETVVAARCLDNVWRSRGLPSVAAEFLMRAHRMVELAEAARAAHLQAATALERLTPDQARKVTSATRFRLERD